MFKSNFNPFLKKKNQIVDSRRKKLKKGNTENNNMLPDVVEQNNMLPEKPSIISYLFYLESIVNFDLQKRD